MEYVKIAMRRVGAVVGKEGETKESIEKSFGVDLDVNSEEGLVKIKKRGIDPLAEWKARDAIKAISYGLPPNSAMKLKDDDYTLILVNLYDIVGRSKKALTRQKARIIGRDGKTKEHISNLTGVEVSLRGKHVAIIGRLEEAAVAKDAIEALAGGLPHGVVYKVLEKKCSAMKKQRTVEMWRNR